MGKEEDRDEILKMSKNNKEKKKKIKSKKRDSISENITEKNTKNKLEVFQEEKRFVTHYISDTAKIGKNVKIWHYTYVGDNTEIGKNVMIGSLVHIDSIDFPLKGTS